MGVGEEGRRAKLDLKKAIKSHQERREEVFLKLVGWGHNAAIYGEASSNNISFI